MEFDGTYRDHKDIRNLFAGFAVLGQGCNLDLPGGKIGKTGGKVLQEGVDNLLKIGFDDVQLVQLQGSRMAFLEFAQVGQDQLYDIGDDLFLHFPDIFLPALENHLQGRVGLRKPPGFRGQFSLPLSEGLFGTPAVGDVMINDLKLLFTVPRHGPAEDLEAADFAIFSDDA